MLEAVWVEASPSSRAGRALPRVLAVAGREGFAGVSLGSSEFTDFERAAPVLDEAAMPE